MFSPNANAKVVTKAGAGMIIETGFLHISCSLENFKSQGYQNLLQEKEVEIGTEKNDYKRFHKTTLSEMTPLPSCNSFITK